MGTSRDTVFLSIAGSDPSGGAGIQADIRTAAAIGLYPCTAVTAVTVQNTQRFTAYNPVAPAVIKAQLQAVLEDFTPEAIKIGMLCSPEAVEAVADILTEYGVANVVIDPILGPTLARETPESDKERSLVKAMIDRLFPLATLVTPNLPEKESIERVAGEKIENLCNAVLIKGGHAKDNEDSIDTLIYRPVHSSDIQPSSAFPTINFAHSSLFNHDHLLPGPDDEEAGFEIREFRQKRLETRNVHGTGCILSSAIACYLGQQYSLTEAVRLGNRFTAEALRKSSRFEWGKGNDGPAFI